MHIVIQNIAEMTQIKPYGKWRLSTIVLIILPIILDVHYTYSLTHASSTKYKHAVASNRLCVNKSYIANYIFSTLVIFISSIIIFQLWLAIFLLISGDVHPNPGPDHSNASSSSTSSSATSSSFHEILASPHVFSFVQYNVQSITHKVTELYSELNCFDVIAFTETWLNNSVLSSDIHFPGYQQVERKDRPGDSHGGVCVYVKDHLYYTRRSDLELPNIECIWLEITFKTKRKLLFGVFYRPPNSNAVYNLQVENSIGLATDDSAKDIIITGDFNFNNHDPLSVKNIDSLCKQFDLEQLIVEETHFTETSSSILDLIFVKNKKDVISSGVGDPFLLQTHRYHCPIFGIIKYNHCKCPTFKRKVWRYKHGDYDHLRSLLSSTNWNTVADNDIEKFALNITSTILSHAKSSIPFKDVTIRPNDAPWMTNDVRKMIRKRKRLYRIAKLKNNPYHWSKFRQFRNETVSEIRLAKESHFSKLADQLKSKTLQSKDWWKILKTFIKPDKQQNINALLDPNTNALAFDELSIANILNSHFRNQTFLDESNVPSHFPDINFSDQELYNIELTPNEIYDILITLNTQKACGPDSLGNLILKECASTLAMPLCLLYNQSLKQSRFPSSWKEANVCAVFKKGDPSIPSNYRPISLLNTIEKVFERAVFKHVFNFLQNTNFFTAAQSGFLPADSTVNQLTYLYNTFCKALDDGLEVRAIFFDISKAFDKVWHKGLLYKLRAAGIRGSLLGWFRDYLTDRRQRVVLPKATSDWATIKAGVPQGSILGPLLFLVFINDIVTDIQGSIRLFADDTNLYIIVDTPTIAAQTLQSDINRITFWASNWLVTLKSLGCNGWSIDNNI